LVDGDVFAAEECFADCEVAAGQHDGFAESAEFVVCCVVPASGAAVGVPFARLRPAGLFLVPVCVGVEVFGGFVEDPHPDEFVGWLVDPVVHG
jgi:hypothetical protein